MRYSARQIIALLLTLLLQTQTTLGSIAESNFWADRREQIQPLRAEKLVASLPLRSGMSLAGLNTSAQRFPGIAPFHNDTSPNFVPGNRPVSNLDRLVHRVSGQFGTINDIHDAGAGPAVLLLQDVHLNPEAQRNIGKIIRGLIQSRDIAGVGLEGVFDGLDFSRLRSFPDRDIVHRVAAEYLNKSLLAAPSFAGITSEGDPPPFFGIDDRVHYRVNVEAFLDAERKQKALLTKIEALSGSLEDRKNQVYNDSLKRLDLIRRAHENGKISFGSYLTQLTRPPLTTGPMTDKFLEAFALEQSLDFSLVQKEQALVLGGLTRNLQQGELQNLLARSADFRTGKISAGDYHRYLRTVSDRSGVGPSKRANFDAYLRYVLLADGLRVETLLTETEELTRRAFDRLATNPVEKSLIGESEFLTLLKKLAGFALTPREWDHYRNAKKTRPIPAVGDISSFERFYNEADARSLTMTKKVEDYLNSEPIKPDGRDLPARDHRNIAVIVGGFHTPEITRVLRENGRSYVVVSPKITKVDDGSEYLSIFAREKTPLDKMFSGERLFINPPHGNIEFPQTEQTFRAQIALAHLATNPSVIFKPSTGIVHERRDLLRVEGSPTPRYASLRPVAGFDAAALPLGGYLLRARLSMIDRVARAVERAVSTGHRVATLVRRSFSRTAKTSSPDRSPGEPNEAASNLPEHLPMDFIILSPVYNEEWTILRTILDARRNGTLERIIFINDASTDRTLSLLHQLRRRDWDAAEQTMAVIQAERESKIASSNTSARHRIETESKAIQEALRALREDASLPDLIHVLSFDVNQHKEGAIRAALEALDRRYGALPDATILMDGDSYFESTSQRTVLNALREGADDLLKNGHAAVPIRISGRLEPGDGFIPWLAAWEWETQEFVRSLFASQSPRLQRLGIRPSVSGGAGIFDTDKLRAALNRHSGTNFEGGDSELVLELIRMNTSATTPAIGRPYQGLRLKTELMADLLSLIEQRTRVWNGIFKNVLPLPFVLLASSAVLFWKAVVFAGDYSTVVTAYWRSGAEMPMFLTVLTTTLAVSIAWIGAGAMKIRRNRSRAELSKNDGWLLFGIGIPYYFGTHVAAIAASAVRIAWSKLRPQGRMFLSILPESKTYTRFIAGPFESMVFVSTLILYAAVVGVRPSFLQEMVGLAAVPSVASFYVLSFSPLSVMAILLSLAAIAMHWQQDRRAGVDVAIERNYPGMILGALLIHFLAMTTATYGIAPFQWQHPDLVPWLSIQAYAGAHVLLHTLWNNIFMGSALSLRYPHNEREYEGTLSIFPSGGRDRKPVSTVIADNKKGVLLLFSNPAPGTPEKAANETAKKIFLSQLHSFADFSGHLQNAEELLYTALQKTHETLRTTSGLLVAPIELTVLIVMSDDKNQHWLIGVNVGSNHTILREINGAGRTIVRGTREEPDALLGGRRFTLQPKHFIRERLESGEHAVVVSNSVMETLGGPELKIIVEGFDQPDEIVLQARQTITKIVDLENDPSTFAIACLAVPPAIVPMYSDQPHPSRAVERDRIYTLDHIARLFRAGNPLAEELFEKLSDPPRAYKTIQARFESEPETANRFFAMYQTLLLRREGSPAGRPLTERTAKKTRGRKGFESLSNFWRNLVHESASKDLDTSRLRTLYDVIKRDYAGATGFPRFDLFLAALLGSEFDRGGPLNESGLFFVLETETAQNTTHQEFLVPENIDRLTILKILESAEAEGLLSTDGRTRLNRAVKSYAMYQMEQRLFDKLGGSEFLIALLNEFLDELDRDPKATIPGRLSDVVVELVPRYVRTAIGDTSAFRIVLENVRDRLGKNGIQQIDSTLKPAEHLFTKNMRASFQHKSNVFITIGKTSLILGRRENGTFHLDRRYSNETKTIPAGKSFVVGREADFPLEPSAGLTGPQLEIVVSLDGHVDIKYVGNHTAHVIFPPDYERDEVDVSLEFDSIDNPLLRPRPPEGGQGPSSLASLPPWIIALTAWATATSSLFGSTSSQMSPNPVTLIPLLAIATFLVLRSIPPAGRSPNPYNYERRQWEERKRAEREAEAKKKGAESDRKSGPDKDKENLRPSPQDQDTFELSEEAQERLRQEQELEQSEKKSGILEWLRNVLNRFRIIAILAVLATKEAQGFDGSVSAAAEPFSGFWTVLAAPIVVVAAVWIVSTVAERSRAISTEVKTTADNDMAQDAERLVSLANSISGDDPSEIAVQIQRAVPQPENHDISAVVDGPAGFPTRLRRYLSDDNLAAFLGAVEEATVRAPDKRSIPIRRILVLLQQLALFGRQKILNELETTFLLPNQTLVFTNAALAERALRVLGPEQRATVMIHSADTASVETAAALKKDPRVTVVVHGERVMTAQTVIAAALLKNLPAGLRADLKNVIFVFPDHVTPDFNGLDLDRMNELNDSRLLVLNELLQGMVSQFKDWTHFDAVARRIATQA